MSTHKTTKNRRKLQKNKAAFTKAREELQLHGHLETTPEGALKDERVNPADQSEQQIPSLVSQAVRNNWATPDHMKPIIVDAMCEPFLKRDTVTAPDGTVFEVPPDRHLLVKNAQVLAMLDKVQYERDHPEDADNSINIDNTVNVVAWDRMAQPAPQVIDPVEDKLKQIEQLANNNKPTEQ